MHVRLCQGCYKVVTRLLQPSFFYMGMQTPDRQYYAIVTVITEMSSSLLYSIVCP